MVEPSEIDILQGKLCDLCDSPKCDTTDEFFIEVFKALKFKEIVKNTINELKNEVPHATFIEVTNRIKGGQLLILRQLFQEVFKDEII